MFYRLSSCSSYRILAQKYYGLLHLNINTTSTQNEYRNPFQSKPSTNKKLNQVGLFYYVSTGSDHDICPFQGKWLSKGREPERFYKYLEERSFSMDVKIDRLFAIGGEENITLVVVHLSQYRNTLVLLLCVIRCARNNFATWDIIEVVGHKWLTIFLEW
jgi:hypothetical protein